MHIFMISLLVWLEDTRGSHKKNIYGILAIYTYVLEISNAILRFIFLFGILRYVGEIYVPYNNVSSVELMLH